jgi:hypothetical protein
VAPKVGPHLLLPVAGERLRARRDAVVVVFTAAKVLACVATTLGWLPIDSRLRQAWSAMLTAVVMNRSVPPLPAAGDDVPDPQTLLMYCA